MRLMLVSRSSRLKPSPLLKCVRTISPSSTSTLRPRSRRRCSIISERVLLPAPESPVNQIVNPVFAMYFFLRIVGTMHVPRSTLFVTSKGFALHIGRDCHVQLLENSWSHVHQLKSGQFAPAGAFMHIG